MTESRYRDAVHREKSKLDTITTENDQLRKIISSDYRSPGIGSLTSTVEGHLSRFTSKVDELRQDLSSAPRVSATPRSQSPAGGYGISPGREIPMLSSTSSA